MNRIELPATESALFQGSVRHRRFQPVRHQFRYPFFMWLLKLDELPSLCGKLRQFGVGRWHWARFRREDYLDEPQRPLAEVVIDKVADGLGRGRGEVEGEVWLLGQLRYLGCYFSPLNLYFIKRDGIFRHALAEVSNTPWNERHCYALDLGNLRSHGKAFHVSPFNPMEQQYHWRILPPDGDRLSVHLQVADIDGGGQAMDATLRLRRIPLDQRALNRMLLRNPCQTAGLLVGIYWQALRLFLKRSPLHPHPDRPGAAGRNRSQRP